MNRIPYVYDHPDVPELFGKAAVMVMMSLVQIAFALVTIVLCTITDKTSLLPLAALFIIPFVGMIITAKKKMDLIYMAAKTKGMDVANELFRSSVVYLQLWDILGFVMIAAVVLIVML